MKAFFKRQLTLSPIVLLALPFSVGARAGDDPTIGGPLVELRKAPVFTAPTIPLAKTWGVALPVGTPFQVEKVYGRWIFGHPTPLPHMRTQDYAPQGWVFSRSLLLPGDSDTLSPAVVQRSRFLLFHARPIWKKLGLGDFSSLDFLETLTLSKRTLAAFSAPETPPGARSEGWIPAAQAAEEPATLGLTGTDLSFLDQEIKVVQDRKKRETRIKEAKKVHVPSPPPLDDKIRTGLLGRYMLERYLEMPQLSMEEVDGHVYMRATAMRALRGCSAKVQNFWKERRWDYFRVFRLKSRSEVKHPWFEIALPGGYFGLSARAIELAGNEAELAFVLVRQLVRELRVKRPALRFEKKGWPENLSPKAEELWDQVLKAQSTKDSVNLDVADEIAVDTQAIACISNAGYRPMAGIAYLRKLSLNKDEPWATWYTQHSIGLDYRIERVTAIVQEALAQEKYPEGKDSREKRFLSAAKQWNILP
ncbi:MAG: hypothetical protein ACXWR1_10555 [Bdellovibrionota bacterium]